MASSQGEDLDHPCYKPTAAPPPTPSSQQNILPASSSAAAADTLAQLLNRLPPSLSLSLPTRRQSPRDTTVPPTVSLSDSYNDLSPAFELGFFQLINHKIPPELARSAESDSASLFNLTREQKQLYFPQNWPLGYDDDGNNSSELFCFDSSCHSESPELKLTSLREFTREMEKIGKQIIGEMSSALGFENPGRVDPTRICSLMWVSEESPGNKPGKLYPYVIALQYQTRSQKRMVLADSGRVAIMTQLDSIVVSFGDITQVWSNGRLKKVRGRPIPCLQESGNSTKCISMTLLLTLPLDATVSTLVPGSFESQNDTEDDDGDGDGDVNTSKNKRLFDSFSFEDYAWRMYHEQHVLKDPLDRYRA